MLSKLVFQWLTPFLEVGFSRPLEEEGISRVNDFWSHILELRLF
jgi:hypothetical protein